MEEVWTDGHNCNAKPLVTDRGWEEGHGLHGDVKKHVSARQGEDIEKQKDRLPPREEVTRSLCVLPFENGIFLTSRSSKQKRFLNGVICGLSDRSGSEGAVQSHRSKATKLSGARMPEQRRAGQLVLNIRFDLHDPAALSK